MPCPDRHAPGRSPLLHPNPHSIAVSLTASPPNPPSSQRAWSSGSTSQSTNRPIALHHPLPSPPAACTLHHLSSPIFSTCYSCPQPRHLITFSLSYSRIAIGSIGRRGSALSCAAGLKSSKNFKTVDWLTGTRRRLDCQFMPSWKRDGSRSGSRELRWSSCGWPGGSSIRFVHLEAPSCHIGPVSRRALFGGEAGVIALGRDNYGGRRRRRRRI